MRFVRYISIFGAIIFAGCATFGQTSPSQDRARWDRQCTRGSGDACASLFGAQTFGYGGEIAPEDAFWATKRACELGVPRSCFEAGVIEKERSLFSEAVAHFERGCLLQDSNSCGAFGIALAQGSGVDTDIVRAEPLLHEACLNGFGEACGILSSLLWDQQRLEEAFSFADLGCRYNDGFSCDRVGVQRTIGSGTEIAENAAFASFIAAHEANTFGAASHLAIMYYHGIGTPIDLDRALELFDEGRIQNDPSAYLGSGIILRSQENPDALQAFSQACELGLLEGCFEQAIEELRNNETQSAMNTLNGLCIDEENPQACRMLGDLSFNQQNNTNASRYYETACELNDSVACYRHGVILSIIGDLENAATQLAQACELGEINACYERGLMDQFQMINTNDPTSWFTRACSDGHERGCQWIQ